MKKLRHSITIAGTIFVASLTLYARNDCSSIFSSEPKAITFNLNESPLTLEEWNQIDLLFKNSTFERQNKGEVADHKLAVSLFVADHNPQHIPQVLNQTAEELLKIINSPKMITFYKNILSSMGEHPEKLHVRRLQGNSMTGSDYNRLHQDNEHDPDFKFAVLFYLSEPETYQGGELKIGTQSIKPQRFSFIAFKADVPHEVTEFKSDPGKTRDSLVLIYGYTPGPNRRLVTP